MKKHFDQNNLAAGIWQKINMDSSVISLAILYIVMLLFFSLSSEHFFSVNNFTSIVNNLVIIGVLSLGEMAVILTKGLDLSIGSTLGLSVVFLTVTFHAGMPIALVILLTIILGCLLGAINGFVVTKIGINPIITTLGTLSIYRGLAYLIGEGVNTRIMHETFAFLGRHLIGGFLPLAFVYMLILYVVMWVIYKYTQFGRNLITVGSDPGSSRFLGLSVEKYKFVSYIISGFMAAIGAVIMTSQLGVGLPSSGTGMELNVITAVVLGGVSLAGGRGNLIGVLIAVLILATITNGLVLLNIPIYWQRVARGLLLVVAITLDTIRRRGSQRERLGG